MVKNLPANSGDIRDSGSVPGSGSSPRGGHGNLLQYSGLENPWTEEPVHGQRSLSMDRGLPTGSQRVRHN